MSGKGRGRGRARGRATLKKEAETNASKVIEDLPSLAATSQQMIAPEATSTINTIPDNREFDSYDSSNFEEPEWIEIKGKKGKKIVHQQKEPDSYSLNVSKINPATENNSNVWVPTPQIVNPIEAVPRATSTAPWPTSNLNVSSDDSINQALNQLHINTSKSPPPGFAQTLERPPRLVSEVVISPEEENKQETPPIEQNTAEQPDSKILRLDNYNLNRLYSFKFMMEKYS